MQVLAPGWKPLSREATIAMYHCLNTQIDLHNGPSRVGQLRQQVQQSRWSQANASPCLPNHICSIRDVGDTHDARRANGCVHIVVVTASSTPRGSFGYTADGAPQTTQNTGAESAGKGLLDDLSFYVSHRAP